MPRPDDPIMEELRRMGAQGPAPGGAPGPGAAPPPGGQPMPGGPPPGGPAPGGPGAGPPMGEELITCPNCGHEFPLF